MLILSLNSRLRFVTGAGLYFAQGIPKGLLNIAMPAWLASQGLSAGEVASYLAIVALPWVFKLVTGPFMDRYQFPAMGLRRPWILSAQLGMAISFCALVSIEDPLQQIGLLTILAALIQAFAATQDVATDGMAIDLVPEEEHGRINASMSFGKALGWASSAAVSGVLLTQFGLGISALVAAGVSIIMFFCFLFVLEREGERRLPWSKGEHAEEIPKVPAISTLIRSLNEVLWTKISLVVFLILFFHGLVNGYGDALMPIAAINLFGFSTETWSNLVATMGLLGAVLALSIGPFIDRFGIKQMSLITTIVIFLHAILLAQTEHLWANEDYVIVMLALWVLLDPVAMVCVIAIGMSICTKRVSATQFAVYMSAANLGLSIGSKMFGVVSEHVDYSDSYFLLAVLILFMLGILLLFNKPAGEIDDDIAKIQSAE